jgi:5-(carboxyamino)imidazole ribonucleotide synthase
LQKQFYAHHQIPTSPFALTESNEDLKEMSALLPGFHKLRRFGYDGKGVQSIESTQDWDKGFTEPGMLEKGVDIDMELSVIVVINEAGESVSFPAVELVFDPKYNLVDYLLSPARISAALEEKAEGIARRTVEAFGSSGIFAVEMFLNKEGEILVNEIAPRTHNSGHQTIEGNLSSQFDQQLRALLNLPLGSTKAKMPSLMINLIGEEGYSGSPVYQGMEDILRIPGVYVHLYGKKETRPGRKMGHVTLIAEDMETLLQRADTVKKSIKVIA